MLHHLVQNNLQLITTFDLIVEICFSGGPLPEDLLSQVKIPVSILWGENDPWEPMDLALKTFANFPCITEFVPLSGGGHCPMDQVPDLLNQEVLRITKSNFRELSSSRLKV